ncbi:MAG: hypothetical protein H6559_16435 [Lewinellaceae bacterium]|nr:hypothetical protein [Lewinellaceae bacterium]
MDDFFQQFRENLENRPEPAFEERDWRGMERLLDEQGKKRPFAPAWWWVLPFLILLLAANAFVLLEQRKANQKLSELASRRDTVYHTRVVYLTDTIYQTVVAGEKQAAPAAPLPVAGWSRLFQGRFTPLLEDGPPSAGLFATGSARPLAAPLRSGERQEGTAPTETAAEAEEAVGEGPGLLLAPIADKGLPPFLSAQRPTLPKLTLEPVTVKRKKTFVQYVYPLRPKGLHLGLGGGGVFPFSRTLTRQAGGLAGLQLAVEFSPQIRMWMDASYFKIYIETDRMDESIGVPAVAPPTDEFAFLKAEVPQPTLQFSAGMQYVFLPSGKWHPFAGLGYGTVSLLPHDVIYEFVNPLTGEEWNFDGSVPGGTWKGGFVFFQGGLEHEFSQRWRAQLSASYRTNWNNVGSSSPRILGARGGLMYKF